MTPDPVTIASQTAADEAVALMAKHDINRRVVSGDGKRVDGVLSRADLLKTYS